MDYHQLIVGLQQEDPKAITRLLDKYTPSLCYFAEKLINNAVEADQIVSKCLVEFTLSFRFKPIKITDEKHFNRLLYSRVWQRCSDFLDKRSKQDNYLKTVTPYYSIDQLIDKTDIARKVDKAFELLPARCRKIAILYFLKDLSQPQIAKELNISTNTVRNQIQIAVEKLSVILSDDEFKLFLLLFSCGSFSMN